jgi:hypothetical protein
MTRLQVLAESPAWLTLLMDAFEKRRSAQALLEGQVWYAAAAGVQTKEGNRLWQKLARRLESFAGSAQGGSHGER